MAANRLFIDTNILVYATDPRSPYRVGAVHALGKARQRGYALVISTQVLREYLAVTTRTNVGSSDVPFTEIFENVRLFRRAFEIVEDRSIVLDHLLELLESIPTAGKQIYDANIVATMQAHGIRSLLTHNTVDFNRFSHLIDLLDI
jgi:predicted nucleic acid-binding protein